MGKVTPETLKPVPLTVAELTVTATLPVELRVRVWVVAVLTLTLPKEMLLELTESVELAALSCMDAVADVPPAVAVMVAVCAVLTEATVAVKDALVAPAATVTEAGTVTALELLARVTVVPPVGAAAFKVAEQVEEPEPVKVVVVQETAESETAPVPLRVTVVVGLLDELVAKAICPDEAPEAVGANLTVSVADWPGLMVTGKVTPEMAKPVPLTVAELIVTGTLPVELRVRG